MASDAAVSNPTYMGNIRFFFRESPDIAHMREFGIDLSTYQGVKDNALRVYFRVKEGSMPPGEPWPVSQVETFYNWMRNGYPRGEGEPVAAEALLTSSTAARIRRNLKDLLGPDGAGELDRLKRAFQALMQRKPEDPTSYFALAGIHWLPGNPPAYYCRHHENAFNPWHRAYLLRFEDALRTVEGCEDITLPYWDIADPDIPAVLWDEPFGAYNVPLELCPLAGPCYSPGPTVRNDAATVWAKLTDPNVDVPGNIVEALGFSHWEAFNGWTSSRTQTGIIKAHDNGHNATGDTMQNQDVAAFDPIFWFFHCNWDRLWWKWQQEYGATTLSAFKTHLEGSPDWLDDPVLNGLAPFSLTTADTIDSLSLGVDYEHPAAEPRVQPRTLRHGSLLAGASFVARTRKVSVRVKDVNRLEIPGSFDVYLKVGDRVVGKQGLFQPTTPKHCATCRKNALASFDFVLDPADLEGGPVQAEIRLLSRVQGEVPFPLAKAGNPTINARLLLEPE
jgi:tyrosinase